jgi:hypothetical protein
VRSEVRLVVALGLAVAGWLFVVPTASSIGTSCGVPLTHGGETLDPPYEPDCLDRNNTRLLQGAMTVIGSVGVLVASVAVAARREAESGRPWRAPPQSHWEDA